MYEDKFIKIACQVSLYFLKTIHRNVIKKSSISSYHFFSIKRQIAE